MRLTLYEGNVQNHNLSRIFQQCALFNAVAFCVFAVRPKILLNTSGCRRTSELLTCECVSRGFPVPVIKWPVLENLTEYSVLTTISSHTVKSSFTITVRDQSPAAVACVSSSGKEEVRQTLTVKKTEKEGTDTAGFCFVFLLALT